MLAGQELEETTGGELLGEVRQLHPHAKRALLVGWGEWGYPRDRRRHPRGDRARANRPLRGQAGRRRPTSSSTRRSRRSCSSGQRSAAPRPTRSTSSATRGRAAPPSSAPCSSSARSRTRSASPTRTRDGSCSGTRPGDAELPVVILPDGTTLVNPSDVELAQATGSAVEPEDTEIDLAHRRRRARGAVGGRLRRLRRVSHARRRHARDRRTGEVELADPQLPRLPARRQRRPARPPGIRAGVGLRRTLRLHAERDRAPPGRGPARRDLSGGTAVVARAVVLATGVTYRRIGIDTLEALSGAGVFYGGAGSDAQRMAGQEVYVLGGANSAGQAALHLARYARRLTLVARAPSLEASMSHYLVRQLAATPNVDVRVGTEVVGGGGDGWLDARRPARPGERYRGDGRRRRPLPLDRGTPAHGVASRRDRARRRGLRSHGRGRPAGRPSGRSSATRSRSRRACRACWRSATHGTDRSSAWRPPSARAPSRSGCSIACSTRMQAPIRRAR